MKTLLIKKTLTVLALGGLGLMATGAQAEDDRFGYGPRASYNQNNQNDHHNYRGHLDQHDRHDGPAFHQGKQFEQQINARQDRQMDRIQHGMRTGSLTRFEFRELMHEQRHIRAMKQQLLADGMIDPREFKRLDYVLEMADRNIRFENHDQQARNQHGYSHRFN